MYGIIPNAKMAQFFRPPPLNTLTSAPIAPPPVSSSPDSAAASAAASIAACKTVEFTPGRGIAAPTLTITIIMRVKKIRSLSSGIYNVLLNAQSIIVR